MYVATRVRCKSLVARNSWCAELSWLRPVVGPSQAGRHSCIYAERAAMDHNIAASETVQQWSACTSSSYRIRSINLTCRMTSRRRGLHPWLVAMLLGGAAAMVRCQQAQALPPPPPPPAAFGTTNANASETVELSQLTVAAVESGSSGQPQLVRQAFLASVNATTSAAGGRQTVSLPLTAFFHCMTPSYCSCHDEHGGVAAAMQCSAAAVW
jgi:hypothetical protein